MTKAQEKISVSIVVAISKGRKSAIGFLPKSWTASDLATIFERDVFPSMAWSNSRRNLNRLIWDNDGRHFSAPWLEVESRLKLRPLRPWPSNSPDFDPIENAFAWMKRFVEGRAPTTEQELREAIQEAWLAFPVEYTDSLMESIPFRLQSCIQLNGARTKY